MPLRKQLPRVLPPTTSRSYAHVGWGPTGGWRQQFHLFFVQQQLQEPMRGMPNAAPATLQDDGPPPRQVPFETLQLTSKAPQPPQMPASVAKPQAKMKPQTKKRPMTTKATPKTKLVVSLELFEERLESFPASTQVKMMEYDMLLMREMCQRQEDAKSSFLDILLHPDLEDDSARLARFLLPMGYAGQNKMATLRNSYKAAKQPHMHGCIRHSS